MAIRKSILMNEDEDILLPFGSDITDDIETTTTASKAYTKGDIFYSVPIRSLVKATTNISANASIAVGTNVRTTSIQEELLYGSGHAIQNESGNNLTRREILQFKGGLKATDDATNEKTVVDGAPTEITWAQYNAMTPEQQAALEHTLVTDVPGADGTISADLMTKLWENPSPTASFSPQTITLSSSDYDFLLWLYTTATNSKQTGIIISKGYHAQLVSTEAVSSSNPIRTREVDYVSDTSYSAQNGIGSNGTTSETNNAVCVPIAVYGIKKTVTVKFDALARDVSTSASKCMLSDGVKSVEDACTWKRLSSTPSSTADVSNISYSELCIIFECSGVANDTFYIPKYMLTNTSKLFRHGFYESASNYADWGIYVSLTSVSCFARKTGTTQTATVDVYYR